MLLQKESLTLTDTALVPVLALALALAMAFGLTVLGVLSDVATVTKGAGLLRTVNFQYVCYFWILNYIYISIILPEY